MVQTGGRWTRILLCGFFVCLTAATLGGFAFRTWLPPEASAHGAGVDRVIRYLLWTTGAIFVLGHAVLALFIWRYSGTEGPRYRPFSRKAEWCWTLVPVFAMALLSEVGVLALGTPVWAEMYGEVPEGALELEVVGRQFAWHTHYPGKDGVLGRTRPDRIEDPDNPIGLDPEDPAGRDDVVVDNYLRLPVDRAVLIRLRSRDVLHSFGIPEFRVKQDLVPGLTTAVQFRPTRAGFYEIACSELCGYGHYTMRGMVEVVSEEEYEQWFARYE